MEHGESAPIELPPGFRFHPTDEEVITHYLLKKVLDRSFKATAISDADLNKCEPWDLPRKANIGEKEWFFFFRRDRKYPTGMRTNRATESGYWKATGKDREIYYKSKNCLVGMKKTLVFYKGRAPKGVKTDWVMHEYRLEGKFSNYNISRAAKEEFVVCRVFHKNTAPPAGIELARIDSFVDHLLDTPTLPPLVDYNNRSNTIEGHNASSSSKVFWDDHKLQYPQYYDPANYLVPLHDIAVPSLYPQASLGFPYEEGLGQMMCSYPPNVFPFKGGRDQEDLRAITPMMEQYFSSKMCNSEETGVSVENVGNETTSLQSKGDYETTNVRPFDYREIEGLGFSPDASDLDSFWSY